MIVTTNDGRDVELTIEEIKYFRAVKRLEKLQEGRLSLFGSGRLDIRLNDGNEFNGWSKDCFHNFNITCEGGDGGD